MGYFSKTVAASVILAVTLLAGCGDFEWFPKSSTFTNVSTGSSSATKPGTLMRELPFPSKDKGDPITVNWVSDVAFDSRSSSFWLLAWTIGSPLDGNAPNALVRINAASGDFISTVFADSWPFTILDGSTLVFDGSFFWITSNGSNSGVAAREVYQILSVGRYIGNKYICPATSTGFCQGLAFDSATSSYWSAGSDNTTLENYQVANNTVSSAATFSNIWSTNGVSDLAFDSASNEVFVVRDGIIRINKSSGAFLGSIPFTLPGSGRGDWDGTFFWVADNSSKSVKALFVR